MYFLAILYLPGTFLHEASHYIFAKLLGVPVGRFSLLPRFEGKGFVMGSVSIQKTDPLRETIIGIAPFVMGCLMLGILTYLFILNWGMEVDLIFGYLILCVLNTMWLSRSDLSPKRFFVLILLLALVLFFVIQWIYEIRS